MKMWKMYNAKVAYLSLASRCVSAIICKRRYRDCLNSWLILTEKKIENKRTHRVSISVAHRIKSEVFNQWYSLAVARETRRISDKKSHFHAWLQYLGHKKIKRFNILIASNHCRLKLYQRGISGFFKHLHILNLRFVKLKLTITLHSRHRIKASIRKLLRNARIKGAIRKFERTFHYWKHISHMDKNRKSTSADDFRNIVDPNIYTNNDSNIKRIDKIRFFTSWKKFIRINLLKKIRVLIRRWHIYTNRRKKLVISAVTKFSDAGKKIRTWAFFNILMEKVLAINESWI